MNTVSDPNHTPSQSPISSTDSSGSEPKRARQHVLLVLLMLLLVPVVYFSQLSTYWRGEEHETMMGQPIYVADLDFWQRTDREIGLITNTRFDLAHDLTDVPLTVGAWHGKEVPETNEEVMILLDPEQYVQRLYQRETGEYLWLSMIGGRSSRPFHAPDICYDADGWQYNLGSKSIRLDDDGEVYGLWLDANKEVEGQDTPVEHIVFYFYLFPDQSRRLTDGIVLFKLTSSRYGTVEETLEVHADFIRGLFTGTMPLEEL